MNASLALSRIAAASAFLVLGCVAGSLQARADTPVVATVLKLHGHWTLNGGAEIRDGQELPAGAVIEPQNPRGPRDPSWTFVALLRGNGQLIGCKRYTESCHLPITLPQSAGGDPAMHLADNIAHGISITSDRRRFVPNHVRSALRGGALVVERIVPLDGTTIDVAAFVVSAPAGRYQLRVRDIDPAHPPSDDVFAAFTWDPKASSTPVQVGALKPGLYEAQLFDADGSYPRTDPVWLGLVDSAGYAAADARFAAVRKLVAAWGSEADPFVVERFLRAGLEYVVDGDVNR